MDVVHLPDLVRVVEQRAGSSPLDRAEAALGVSEELASGADELIGHFVTEARQAGCSWTQIGERIGVSKQAARQRFTLRPAAASAARPEPQPRLVACLAAAAREASADGAAEIGTHHQLLGLYQEGVAAAILEKAGVRAGDVRQAARAMFPGGGAPGEQPPPESAEARAAVEGAAGLARRAGLPYVGTEHLLGALALDPGSRARRVLGHLDVSVPARESGPPSGVRSAARIRPAASASSPARACGSAPNASRSPPRSSPRPGTRTDPHRAGDGDAPDPHRPRTHRARNGEPRRCAKFPAAGHPARSDIW